MVNLYEGLIVAVEVSPRSEPTYRNQHIPVPVIRVPLFPFRYNFPPPRRSPWVTSREHFGGPLSPPRINLWPRKREGDCLCSHALGGLPTTSFYEFSIVSTRNERCQFSANARAYDSLFLFVLFYNEFSSRFLLLSLP